MFDWLIIGGGIQGCTAAVYFLKQKKVSIDKLAIIDPNEKPLSMWLHCTSTIDMPYLRSPSIHHLAPAHFDLEKFAKTTKGKSYASFYKPYDRPGLQLFNTHCEHLFKETNLQNSWIQGRVFQLKKEREYWKVFLKDGQQLESNNVLLAIGLSEHPYWPDWALTAKENGASISHIFECEQKVPDSTKSLTIIGGGITAAHAAIKWSRLLPSRVTQISRHSLRVHQFDSDPGWLGPKLMRNFHAASSYEKRREMIRLARHRGSLPLDIKAKVSKQIKNGSLYFLQDEVSEVQSDSTRNEVKLQSGQKISSDHILLATGFHQSPPGIEWLKPTIEERHLQCATCGYPILSTSLQWDDGLYAIGALSELEIGPVARNISGARRGIERILKSI
ncbi:FAD-dependent oxidoreductase [Alkalihalobacillus sp. BA299]|uniref:FAD-dependent oxidoreductase n=1 Tax=Alkalihalobacillus sp. BA299 TaxID=2815938 RepID=UPI001ADAF36B|nr:FAD/NAD(P)-binding protein [Alkalihalobacillus sp. BA299]